MFSWPSHLFLVVWILLFPVTEAVGTIITIEIDDYESNVRWIILENNTPKKFTETVAWIKELNNPDLKGHLGYTDWELPDTPDGVWDGRTYNRDDNDSKINVTYSDLGHIYYTVKKYSAIPLTETPPTSRAPLTKRYYWLGTGDDGLQFSHYNNEQMAWVFDFTTGWQFLRTQNTNNNTTYALAVRTEPLPASAIPEPNTALLFLTGLLCLTYRPSSQKQLM